MGPLQADPNVQPCFAQVYVLDPSQETTTRIANMNLPIHMTQNGKSIMRKLLKIVQKCVHEYNPYVREFKQVLEIPDEHLNHGKIVISSKARPENGHPRVYNAQVNLQELSIVTNEQPHDLVIHPRGGGLKIISDLNSSAMPLHFTLLFIHGTPGWHTGLKHTNGKNRITPREFYAYHLNVRKTDSDYIFSGGRLTQEWILNGWITCENQRLNYMRYNQKTLRAERYKNLRDFVNKRRQERDQELNDGEQETAAGRVILPSSYIGSARWYNSKFQDAMAIVRHYAKPTLFIIVCRGETRHFASFPNC